MRWIRVVLALAATNADLPAQTVRDSAGVQIVENRGPGLPPARAWRVAPMPFVTIGDPGALAAPDTTYELSLVMGVARLSDGRWAVPLQMPGTVRFFHPDGRFDRAAGRRGNGPGEFQQVLRLFRLAGDTLLVSDVGEAEYFAASGEWLRLGASRSRGTGRFIFPYAAFDDQAFAGFDLNDPTERPAPGGVRQVPLVVVSRDGLERRTLGLVAAAVRVPSPRGLLAEPVFAARGHLAASGMLLYYAFGARYEVFVYDRDGRIARIVRREHAVRAVTEGDRAAYREQRREFARAINGGAPLAATDRARLDRFLDELVFAETLPAVGAILADRTGHLWVRGYDTRETMTPARMGRGESLPSTPTPDSTTSWDVFDARGRWLCTVELPARFTPFDIGADYVAGVARNEDDVELVRAYRLIKP